MGTRESGEASASIPFSSSFLCYRESHLFPLHILFFTCNQWNRILLGSNSGFPMVSIFISASKSWKMCKFIFSLLGGKRLINGPFQFSKCLSSCPRIHPVQEPQKPQAESNRHSIINIHLCFSLIGMVSHRTGHMTPACQSACSSPYQGCRLMRNYLG